ncbi:MAG: GtrA family protein [Acidovorax sp.]|uniref:GtrA family protein n=1 Tax=Acidovorax sp. TaxID=1872122 RepID=UPI0039E2A9B0
MKSIQRLLWFGVAGVTGLAVDMGTLMILHESMGAYGARIASFLTAATATWLINRRLTFTGRSAGVGIWGEYVRYLGLMLGGGVVNLTVYSLLAWKFSQTPLWLNIYVCAGSLAGMAINYLGTNQWLYRHKGSQESDSIFSR